MSGPPKLTVVPDSVYRLDRPPETIAERARRRQFEAKMLAREHIGELRQAMAEALTLTAVLTEGGDVYPAGVRDASGRILAHLEAQIQTLDSLLERIPEPQL
jgi:hypothetical protein